MATHASYVVPCTNVAPAIALQHQNKIDTRIAIKSFREYLSYAAQVITNYQNDPSELLASK